MLALASLKGLVVIDEIQRQPDLFSILRVLVDKPASPTFLILGSASPSLMRGVSQSLAGRVESIELSGLGAFEVDNTERLWLRGGFPRSYLAKNDHDSQTWCAQFVQTFLEKDMAFLGPRTSQAMMRRFWTLLGHYHSQTWNSARFARALGVSDHTARHYLDMLEEGFMVRQLAPWFTNTSKRVIKAPKIYLRDSGLFHSLMGIPDYRTLSGHPSLGASWEGFALEQVLLICDGDPYFWAKHGGGEIDLILHRRRKTHGFEFKHTDAPSLTRSMADGIAELSLDHLWVIYPGKKEYALSLGATALPLTKIDTIQKQAAT